MYKIKLGKGIKLILSSLFITLLFIVGFIITHSKAKIIIFTFSFSFLLLWKISLFFSLRECVSFKYRVEKKYSSYYSVKYLTFWWFLIPYWRPIKETIESYEVQNLFGATRKHMYDKEVYFKSEEDAKRAISAHREELKNNLNLLFKFSKEKRNISYY